MRFLRQQFDQIKYEQMKKDQLKSRVLGLPVLGVLFQAGLKGIKGQAKDRAASIAFFSLLSMFPLYLGLIALTGTILKSERLRAGVMDWVNEFFPVGADYVTRNIETLIQLRSAAGVVSMLVLFWSASKMVGAISRGVNRALEQKRSHAFYLSPLRNYGLTLAIAVLMLVATAIIPIADLVSNLELGVLGSSTSRVIELTGSRLVSLLATTIMITVIYTLIPYQRPARPDLLPGLFTATLLIELGKKGFVYYVDHSSKLDALYGSISSIIVLMLWLYYFGHVLLLGASVIRVRQLQRLESSEPLSAPLE